MHISAENIVDIKTLTLTREIKKRRYVHEIVKRLIDIIMCVAKIGLAYSGKVESVHTLCNSDLNQSHCLAPLLTNQKNCILLYFLEAHY